MRDDDKKKPGAEKTLTDDQISTDRGRRNFLGMMAVGGAAALTGTPAAAQSTDADNGNWTDRGGCGRGYGGLYTGLTDADNGNITDAVNYGRGAPYC